MAELHGDTVRILSGSERGARVRIELPTSPS
ncbi:hypothetical protein EN852_014900 [Mesorhizobium sp. M2E.F.Ca.ET.209.01.1.1]|nr:hypothetical protein EN852_014900 [Mesorhizobium sp. M2E.F.Ca.ET.209.01.1.1]